MCPCKRARERKRERPLEAQLWQCRPNALRCLFPLDPSRFSGPTMPPVCSTGHCSLFSSSVPLSTCHIDPLLRLAAPTSPGLTFRQQHGGAEQPPRCCTILTNEFVLSPTSQLPTDHFFVCIQIMPSCFPLPFSSADGIYLYAHIHINKPTNTAGLQTTADFMAVILYQASGQRKKRLLKSVQSSI